MTEEILTPCPMCGDKGCEGCAYAYLDDPEDDTGEDTNVEDFQ